MKSERYQKYEQTKNDSIKDYFSSHSLKNLVEMEDIYEKKVHNAEVEYKDALNELDILRAVIKAKEAN